MIESSMTIEELAAKKVNSVIKRYKRFKETTSEKNIVQLKVMPFGRPFEMAVSRILHTEEGLIIFIGTSYYGGKVNFIQHVSQFDNLGFLFTEISPDLHKCVTGFGQETPQKACPSHC